MTTQAKPKPQAKGAHARAAALSPARRAEISRLGGLKKAGVPLSTHRGSIKLGEVEIECYVLEDGRRVLTQESFLKGMGRAAKAKGGHGVLTTVDDTPAFLAASNLKPLIEKEILSSTAPVEFASLAGQKIRGYAAELLPEVCRVYLAARDAKLLMPSQRHIAERSDMLVRALASLGIVALVDEATGYEKVRDRGALQALLDKYLRQEHAAWAKRFPDEFYKEMFRLRGWNYPTPSGARPGVVGTFTNDLVYERLAPGLLAELEARNPKMDTGSRRSKHHQWMTDDVGNPALTNHMHAVLGFMRAADSWDQLMRMMDRAFPKKGTQIPLLQD
jgi:hypothetical protein